MIDRTIARLSTIVRSASAIPVSMAYNHDLLHMPTAQLLAISPH